MDDAELERIIVTRLGNNADPNDLILEVCEKSHLSWPEAEALVQRIAVDREHAIAGRQFPLLFVIALGIFAGGLALVSYESYVLISMLETDLRAAFAGLDTITGLRLIFDISVTPLTGMVVGAAMMLGSLAGMRRAWVPVIGHLLEKGCD